MKRPISLLEKGLLGAPISDVPQLLPGLSVAVLLDHGSAGAEGMEIAIAEFGLRSAE